MPWGKEALLVGAQHIPATTNEQSLWERFLGIKVTAAVIWTADLDESFDVTGPCLAVLTFGEVTTTLGSDASLNLEIKTTTDLICAATAVESDADGEMYTLSGVPADGLINVAGDLNLGAYAGDHAQTPIILGGEGTAIVVQSNTPSTDAGGLTWTMFYVPLGTSATVSASS